MTKVEEGKQYKCKFMDGNGKDFINLLLCMVANGPMHETEEEGERRVQLFKLMTLYASIAYDDHVPGDFLGTIREQDVLDKIDWKEVL